MKSFDFRFLYLPMMRQLPNVEASREGSKEVLGHVRVSWAMVSDAAMVSVSWRA